VTDLNIELAERAKTEKVWLAGFNATFGET